MNLVLMAEQLRRTMQLYASTLSDEQAMEVSTVYDPWKIGRMYSIDEIISYGVNSVGDPQLYRVNQAHTSQANWVPDVHPALYTPIGLDDSGYPIWSQPTGSHDAYNTGGVVNYNGTLYESTIDGNVWSPESYPAGWKLFIE